MCESLQTEMDSVSSDLHTLQLNQNKMLRVITDTKIYDHKPISNMLKSTGFSSVNQLNSEIKLNEGWKSLNVPNYPLTSVACNNGNAEHNNRSRAKNNLQEIGKSNVLQNSFSGDMPRVWNKAPVIVKQCKSRLMVKKEIKKYAKSLPI